MTRSYGIPEHCTNSFRAATAVFALTARETSVVQKAASHSEANVGQELANDGSADLLLTAIE